MAHHGAKVARTEPERLFERFHGLGSATEQVQTPPEQPERSTTRRVNSQLCSANREGRCQPVGIRPPRAFREFVLVLHCISEDGQCLLTALGDQQQKAKERVVA
jgi:hypothetical protein